MKIKEEKNEQLMNRVELCYDAAFSDLKKLGINAPKDRISLSINQRAKRRLGCCKLNRSDIRQKYAIEISLVCSNLNDFELKNIVMHELIHTLPGCMNHGAKWKDISRRVNAAYGYNITTTADYSKIGLDGAVSEPIYNYKVTCESCGQSLYRIKRSKIVRNPGMYRCSKCGGFLRVERLDGKIYQQR